MTQCVLVVAVILKCSTSLAVNSENSTVSVIFPLASLLCSLYWPWDPLSSLKSTPVSIWVPKQVDCNTCRFSKLLLFSFFFCKDGSDRLMKRASSSCCNFPRLCVVLAATYLKYRQCRLSCLLFVWHLFSLSLTYTHTGTCARKHTHAHTHTHTCMQARTHICTLCPVPHSLHIRVILQKDHSNGSQQNFNGRLGIAKEGWGELVKWLALAKKGAKISSAYLPQVHRVFLAVV